MPPNNTIKTGQAAIDQRNRDIAAYKASPYYKAPTPAPVAPVAPTAPAVVPKRTPGLLEQAQKSALVTENSQRDIQRQADQYAASQRQARIDAINVAFAPRIAREQEEGANRIDRVKAIAFKQGIVGSGVDTTKIGEQSKLNKEALEGIENEKAILINEAFGAADKLGKERAETLTGEAKVRADSNVNFYKERASEAMDALKLFGQANTSLEDILETDPNTVKTLREVSGLSDAQIAAIVDAARPTPTNVDTRIENGYMVSSYFDPQTRKFKSYTEKLDIPAETKASDIQVLTAQDGSFIAYDKTNDRIVRTINTTPTTPKVSWEEYLNAAQEVAGQTFNSDARAKLKKQYDSEVANTGTTPLTDSEKKKLEQAGLLGATRQKQLDYLYSKSDREL